MTALLAQDAQRACELLSGVFERSGNHDGYVSVDLEPATLSDATATVRHAHELNRSVDRPNLLVKIPACGFNAIRACLAEGVGVQVTGVFSVSTYRKVLDAHLEGLELARGAGIPLGTLGSVAALPVRLLDHEVDRQLDELARSEGRPLRGTVALATARLMYAAYEEYLGSERWRALRVAGAQPQRPMWSVAEAAEDTAGPEPEPCYSYLSRLVGWGTVSELDQDAVTEFAAHGTRPGHPHR
ncbi:hypothetical protein GXW82_41450 [Streptacidiphilus sp. 4-A2]|nr:hypothetical protein [Streptacidiphilus sp. 4-A2]